MLKPVYLSLIFLFYAWQADAREKKVRDIIPNRLDLVFCLDLSGSTNGLISDVREGLWHIVNQVNLLEPKPHLRIGLVGFSRPSFMKDNAYVKVLCELTTDFDLLSHKMYKIRPAIEKGDQYVGVAINTCVTKLNWDEQKGTTKIIYMVGNGRVGTNNNDYIKACQLALQHNIVLNSIYVMGRSDKAKEMPGWYRIAKLTNGLTSEISIGRKKPLYDKQVDMQSLIAASQELNRTYTFHGVNGYERFMSLKEADSAALAGTPATFFERAYYKNSTLFRWANAKWDMVDYLKLNGMLPPLEDTLYIPDSLRLLFTENIYDLVQQQKSNRQRVISKIEILFKDNYPLRIHQQYISGELKEENSFSGSVIIMLMKEWK